MINLAFSLGLAILVSFGFLALKVQSWISIPMGIISGFLLFIFLGRKIQVQLEAIMARMQKDMQDSKIDRAIETLKEGFELRHRHFFISGQLNAQIGVLYYLQGPKKYDLALDHFKKGFVKHFIAQGMMAVIYYKRKNYDAMKETMDRTVQASKKESIVYGLYAYLLYQIKDKEKAIEVLQKGIKKLPGDEKLTVNLVQLQNNKKMKMKVYGEMWVQFMLERAPRIQQQAPPHMRMSRKAMFRGR